MAQEQVAAGTEPQGLEWTARTVAQWISYCCDALERAESAINDLNVFPVPDGDTGTNMLATFVGVRDELANDAGGPASASADRDPDPRADLVACASRMRKAALLAARGNSGVISSQIVRGICDGLAASDGDDTERLVQALSSARELAYAAVDRPREGTILSVIAAASRAAADESGDAGTGQILERTVDAARIALAATTDQLEVLRDAGVVDAGGQGLVVVLAALADAYFGRPLQFEDIAESAQVDGDAAVAAGDSSGSADNAVTRHTVTYGGPEYEVMYLTDMADEDSPQLREVLGGLGDSLVVVGGEGLWNVHVHVDDIGAAIEAGIEYGRPHQIRVTRLENVRRSGSNASTPEQPPTPREGRHIVAVTHGPGVADFLRQQGVTIVEAIPGRRPSTGEMLDAIYRCRGSEVVVLPSDKDTVGAAQIAAEHARGEGIEAHVVPSVTIVQTLAAVAVANPAAKFSVDIDAMRQACEATAYGAVTTAVRTAQTPAGPCQPGDIIGLVNGTIVVVGEDMAEVAWTVVDGLVGDDSEFVTIVSGSDVDAAVVEGLQQRIASSLNLDVDVVAGRQPLWPLIIGVE